MAKNNTPNSSIELTESFKCYNLQKQADNKDVIPKWIEKVIEPKGKQRAPITDMTGIWP